MSLRPFPWSSLPRRTRLSVFAAHQARATLIPRMDVARVASEASTLLRQSVEITPREIMAEPILPVEHRIGMEFQGTG
ncbi:MAG: hypothetical protein RMJ98_08960, partial [Myxococcales bacterium]|nr:hypothetical protein [Myxococcales bacterium]